MPSRIMMRVDLESPIFAVLESARALVLRSIDVRAVMASGFESDAVRARANLFGSGGVVWRWNVRRFVRESRDARMSSP